MTHNAGRKLDALVAEKVMGRKWDEARCRICGWPIVDNQMKGCVKDNCSMRPYPDRHADEPASYSTDLAAAWRVVEQLTASGFHFLLLKSADSKLSIASFYLGPQDRSDESATDSSTTLAICLAALKATEGA